MKKQVKKSFRHKGLTGKKDAEKLPGYPLYPASEDIYNKSKKVMKIDTEEGIVVINPGKKKEN